MSGLGLEKEAEGVLRAKELLSLALFAYTLS